MKKHTVQCIASLILIVGACAPLPSPVPETITSVPSTLTPSPTSTPTPGLLPTDTPTPTVEIQPSKTPSPVATFTFSIPIETVRTTRIPPRTKIPPAAPTSTATVETPSQTPSITPTLACEGETASVVLSASAGSVKVGEAVQITVTINNEGCVGLGLPQYRLYIQSDASQSVLIPQNPEPIVHYLAVAPGQSDFAKFDLIAAAGGQATLTATVSYEVHLGYPGPAYWGMTGSGVPLIITVAP